MCVKGLLTAKNCRQIWGHLNLNTSSPPGLWIDLTCLAPSALYTSYLCLWPTSPSLNYEIMVLLPALPLILLWILMLAELSRACRVLSVCLAPFRSLCLHSLMKSLPKPYWVGTIIPIWQRRKLTQEEEAELGIKPRAAPEQKEHLVLSFQKCNGGWQWLWDSNPGSLPSLCSQLGPLTAPEIWNLHLLCPASFLAQRGTDPIHVCGTNRGWQSVLESSRALETQGPDLESSLCLHQLCSAALSLRSCVWEEQS